MKTCFDLYPNRQLKSWPLWMMRQAGRTLPEYRKLRKNFDSFFKMMLNPLLIAEITMQPLRRWDSDAAIIFSDILLPLADLHGANVSFDRNFHPGVSFVDSDPNFIMDKSAQMHWTHLSAVLEGMSLVKSKLTEGQECIGFCGGPWTLFGYCIGKSAPLDWVYIINQIKQLSITEQNSWKKLLIWLAVESLLAQEKAGATQLMIFDSWTSFLPAELYEDWIGNGLIEIARELRRVGSVCPIIVYAPKYTHKIHQEYNQYVDIVACDVSVDMSVLQPSPIVLQGNFNVNWLMESQHNIEDHVIKWITSLKEPVILNLSAGLNPETPLENIEKFVTTVRRQTQLLSRSRITVE
ncbi:MAG: hypothetical protein FJ161_02390 [Gammaproteobacteria bacterium]|nr:hypothetical protein [Gammaproteobacteria bacterium]